MLRLTHKGCVKEAAGKLGRYVCLITYDLSHLSRRSRLRTQSRFRHKESFPTQKVVSDTKKSFPTQKVVSDTKSRFRHKELFMILTSLRVTQRVVSDAKSRFRRKVVSDTKSRYESRKVVYYTNSRYESRKVVFDMRKTGVENSSITMKPNRSSPEKQELLARLRTRISTGSTDSDVRTRNMIALFKAFEHCYAFNVPMDALTLIVEFSGGDAIKLQDLSALYRRMMKYVSKPRMYPGHRLVYDFLYEYDAEQHTLFAIET